MRDSGDEPPKPGWGLDFRSPASHSEEPREYSFSPSQREEFPRLADTPPPGPPGRINGVWGLVPLATFILLFVSLTLAPTTPEVESEDDSADIVLGLIIIGGVLAAYVAGSVAAFRGSRKGLTWSLPATAILFVIVLAVAFDPEGEGGSRAAAVAVGVSAAVLHLAAAFLSAPRNAEPAPFA